MTVGLSKNEMATIAGWCDDVKEGVIEAGTTVAGQPKTGLDGFLLQSAIGDVNEQFRKQTTHSGGQWRYFASSVRATAADITATDEAAAFTFPPVGDGETGIPMPFPFAPLGALTPSD